MSSIQTKKSLNDDEGIPRYSDLLNVNLPSTTVAEVCLLTLNSFQFQTLLTAFFSIQNVLDVL